jgi:dTDP-glucose 4,6-dehydratase|tara:strand:+ start:179 stop:1177 length:999 start_codon:yes stop_codon:yes gene_type:complete
MSLANLSRLENKEVLITGGCGFIGSEIVRQLSTIGANVTIIDNLSSGKQEYIEGIPNVKLINANIVNEDAVKSVVKDKEYIINNAALPFIPDSYYMPKKFFDVNVNATINLALAAIKEKKVKRFTHISSSEIYGTAKTIPMDENHVTLPQSTYAVSKLAGERVVFTMHKEHHLPAVIIRPFNSYGPNITQPYIIPEIITQILKGDKVKLGNINAKRDFTYVSDTARAIILSLITDGIIGEVINVGSQRSYSIKELVNLISELMGKKISIEMETSRFRPYDVDVLICNYERANRLLNWKPEISIRQGLKETIEWIKKENFAIKVSFTERYGIE